MATPVSIGGKRIGKLRASYLLFKESWRFLARDKEMLLIPLVATVLNLFLCGIVVTVAAIAARASGTPLFTGDVLTGLDYAFIFCFYVVGAFTLAISQAGIINTVYTRIHGGDATLGQSLKVAFSHSGSLLVWSAITSTVGLILNAIAERSALIGKIITGLIGAGWNVVTFFVIPAMVIDHKSAFASIPHSLAVFKHTWGETLVSNISLGVFFFAAHMLVLLSFVGIIIMGVSTSSLALIILAIIGAVLWLILASLVQAALSGVLKTLLYVYATERIVPQNFNAELLEAMLAKRGGVTEPVMAAAVPVSGVGPIPAATEMPTAEGLATAPATPHY